MKRQKKVFKSHAEVTHIWAQQTQEEGRAGNIFFSDTTDIYSYGYHYLMAKVHTVNGVRLALVNSDSHSSSTSQHLGYTRSALGGLMPYFEVPNPRDLDSAVAYLDKEVTNHIKGAMSRKFFADSRWNEYNNEKETELARINSAYKTATEFRALIGLEPAAFPQKEYDTAKAHLQKLLDRYNSPERVAKRAKKELERAEERKQYELKWAEYQKEQAAKSAEALSDFRAGLEFGSIDSEYDLLRIKGSRVETSRGAIVPLKAARQMLARLVQGELTKGEMIGDYTFTEVFTEENGELIVSIGCHRIQLSEIRNVLGAGLSLVREVAHA